jgi:hypothetical protein
MDEAQTPIFDADTHATKTPDLLSFQCTYRDKSACTSLFLQNAHSRGLA